MTRLLIGLLGAAVIGTGGYAAASGLGGSDPARTVSLPAATTGDDDTPTQATTTQATTTLDTATTAGTTTAEDEVDDISGPCDEAEHANDPRCTGTGAAEDDRDDDDEDRSGRRGGDDDDDEDRSGSNSGKG